LFAGTLLNVGGALLNVQVEGHPLGNRRTVSDPFLGKRLHRENFRQSSHPEERVSTYSEVARMRRPAAATECRRFCCASSERKGPEDLQGELGADIRLSPVLFFAAIEDQDLHGT
jgi:hypothetical protein